MACLQVSATIHRKTRNLSAFKDAMSIQEDLPLSATYRFTSGKIRRGRAGMECISVQGVVDKLRAGRCIDCNLWLIGNIRHRGVASPVPVRDAKGCRCCLILCDGSARISRSDLLGIVVDDLLRHLNGEFVIREAANPPQRVIGKDGAR